jgi:hypothetical protein
MAALGIPMDIATSIAAAQGPAMGRAILALYRSASQPAMAEAGRALWRTQRLGRDFPCWPPTIHTSAPTKSAVEQPNAPARTEVLDGLGHWWMVQDPARGAAALTGFWQALGQ